MPSYRLILFACAVAFTAGELLAEPPGGGAGMPGRADIEAALQACASSIESDSDGRPDMSAMESCMSAKGYSRPGGPHGPGESGGGHGNPPPAQGEYQ
jgi:hypothetical protein